MSQNPSQDLPIYDRQSTTPPPVPARGLRGPLVIKWQWVPLAPLALDQALPDGAVYGDSAALRAVVVPEAELETFRFGFPRLARLTPDLHFYRLVRVLNTPLLSLTSRDAGRSGFAYWRGEMPTFRDEIRWAHFWFFEDKTDDDLIVVEYGFSGDVVLRSRSKSSADLAVRYAALVKQAERGCP